MKTIKSPKTAYCFFVKTKNTLCNAREKTSNCGVSNKHKRLQLIGDQTKRCFEIQICLVKLVINFPFHRKIVKKYKNQGVL